MKPKLVDKEYNEINNLQRRIMNNAIPPAAAGAGAGVALPPQLFAIPPQLFGPFTPLQHAVIQLLKQVSITHHGEIEEATVINYAFEDAHLSQATINHIIAQRDDVENDTRARFHNIDQDEGDDAHTDLENLQARTTACEANVTNTNAAIGDGRAAIVWHTVSDHHNDKYVPLYGLTGNQLIDSAMARVSRYVTFCYTIHVSASIDH